MGVKGTDELSRQLSYWDTARMNCQGSKHILSNLVKDCIGMWKGTDKYSYNSKRQRHDLATGRRRVERLKSTGWRVSTRVQREVDR